METGNIPSPSRKSTAESFGDIADAGPSTVPGPTRRLPADPFFGSTSSFPNFDFDGLSRGSSVMNGASGFAIDKATFVGGNNIQGQATPAMINVYGGSYGIHDREERGKAFTWDAFLRKERELRDKETYLNARAASLAEREKALEDQKRSLDRLIQSLKEAEVEWTGRREAELQRMLTDASHSGLGPPVGWKYVRGFQGAFGECAVGINDMARQFNFTGIDLADRNEQPAFYVPLAPHYGGLNKEQIENFPESIKVAISSVVANVQAARTDTPFNWHSVKELLTTNSHLESSGKAKHDKDGPIWLKDSFKSTDLSVLNEWLQILFTSGNLRDANQSLSNIRKEEKGQGQDLPSYAYDKRSLIDILVLWFPVDVRRTFQLSRTTVKLCTTPSRQSRLPSFKRPPPRYFILTEHQTSLLYYPRESFIWKMEDETRAAIIRGAESLIDE